MSWRGKAQVTSIYHRRSRHAPFLSRISRAWPKCLTLDTRRDIPPGPSAGYPAQNFLFGLCFFFCSWKNAEIVGVSEGLFPWGSFPLFQYEEVWRKHEGPKTLFSLFLGCQQEGRKPTKEARICSLPNPQYPWKKKWQTLKDASGFLATEERNKKEEQGDPTKKTRTRKSGVAPMTGAGARTRVQLLLRSWCLWGPSCLVAHVCGDPLSRDTCRVRGRALYGPIPVKTETFRERWALLVHTNFGGNSYGPIIGPYVFLGKQEGTNGPESSSKVSPIHWYWSMHGSSQCRATRVAADFLRILEFSRCSSSIALQPPKRPCLACRPWTATRQAASEKVSRYRGV